MQKITGCFLIVCIVESLLLSCTTQSNDPYIDLSQSEPLDHPVLLFRFNNKVPIDIAVKDSLAILLFYKEDTCGAIYNLNTKKKISSFGIVGNGPGEITGINFLVNKNEALQKDSICFYDMNQGRLLAASIQPNNHFELQNIRNSPNALYSSYNQNIANNLMVARRVRDDGYMFFIYNMENQDIKNIEYYPKISNLDIRARKSTYAPRLALNEAKGKIIAGMYYLDLIHIYKINGEREKTIYFSKQWMPPVEKNKIDFRSRYTGSTGIFPTDKYCYVLRRQLSTVKTAKIVNTHLIQLDWNGNLIKSYALKGDFVPGLFIHEEQNIMYAIQINIESDNAEYYDVVKYDLK